jgi:hypothetical protein
LSESARPSVTLYLDVDGVLTASATCHREGDLDEGCLGRLKQLTDFIAAEGTEARIILSTTWRMQETYRRILRAAFERHGIPAWQGITPAGRAKGRWPEIAAHLIGQSFGKGEGFLVLDDLVPPAPALWGQVFEPEFILRFPDLGQWIITPEASQGFSDQDLARAKDLVRSMGERAE